VVREGFALLVLAALLAVSSPLAATGAPQEPETGVLVPVELEATTVEVAKVRDDAWKDIASMFTPFGLGGLLFGRDRQTVYEHRQQVAGAMLGAPVSGTASILEVQTRPAGGSGPFGFPGAPYYSGGITWLPREVKLSGPVGTVTLEFAGQTASGFWAEAKETSGLLSGAAVRGILRFAVTSHRTARWTGYLVAGVGPERLAEPLAQEGRQAPALAPALMPFPLRVQPPAVTQVRFRAWRSGNEARFQLYVLVGKARSEEGKPVKISVVVSDSYGQRRLLDVEHRPGAQEEVSGAISPPGAVSVLESGRVVRQFTVVAEEMEQ
jgi:hypothetical protein